jgi:hypothetical protein
MFSEIGTKIIVSWDEDKFKDDWKGDGYAFRQQMKITEHTLPRKFLFPKDSEDFLKAESEHRTVSFSHVKYKLRINCGDLLESFTTKFIKKALRHQDYPNHVLVLYEGDERVINPQYSHGNAKRREKIEKPFYKTTPSVLKTAKERKEDQPAEVYGDMIANVGPNMKKQAVQAPRDIKKSRMRKVPQEKSAK